MAMYLGKQRAVILSQKYTTEKFSFRKTLNFGGLSQSTLFRVKKVKGATVKSKNLIPYPYTETTKTMNGITFTDNGDGSITVNGTATGSASFFLIKGGDLPVGTYTISGKKDGIVVNARKNNNSWLEESSWITPTGQFNEGDVFDYISIYVAPNTVANNVRIYPMFNEGETALPHQPYFTGLKHAYINAIKSTGKNLLNLLGEKEFTIALDGGDASKFIIDEYEITNTSLSNWGMDGIKFKNEYPAGTYTINCEEILTTLDASSTNYKTFGILIYCDEQPVVISGNRYIQWNTYYNAYLVVRNENVPCAFTTNKKFSIGVTFRSDGEEGGLTTTYKKIQMSLGSTNTAFEPYKEDTWQLSETLELGEWDELNPPTGEVKRYTENIVFNGTEAWFSGLSNKSGVYRKAILGLILGTNSVPAVVSNVISTHYETLSGDDTYLLNKGISMHGGDMYIYDPDFDTSDISLWKAHLAELYANGNPLTVAYEKVEPTVEKIEGCPLSYTAFKGGTETVIQGEENNSQFKAIPTIETGHTVMMEIIGDKYE